MKRTHQQGKGPGLQWLLMFPLHSKSTEWTVTMEVSKCVSCCLLQYTGVGTYPNCVRKRRKICRSIFTSIQQRLLSRMLVKQLFAILTCVPAHAGNPPAKRGPALRSLISQTAGKRAGFKTHARRTLCSCGSSNSKIRLNYI